MNGKNFRRGMIWSLIFVLLIGPICSAGMDPCDKPFGHFNMAVTTTILIAVHRTFYMYMFNRMFQLRNDARLDSSGFNFPETYLASNGPGGVSGGHMTDGDGYQWFAKAFGTMGDREAETGRIGYQYEMYGAIMGVDKRVNDEWIVGMSFLYGNGRAWGSNSLLHNDIDTFGTSIYASWFNYEYFVDVALSYAHGWHDLKRRVPVAGAIAHSEPEDDIWSISLEGGKDFYTDLCTIEPFAGMSYTAVQSRGYRESGAGTANLSVDRNCDDIVDSTLGVRLFKDFQLGGRPCQSRMTFGWRHIYSDNIRTTSSLVTATLDATGASFVRDTALMGVGFDTKLTSNVNLFVELDSEFADQFASYTGQIGVKCKF